MSDASDELQQAVLSARSEGQHLAIVGSGSKSHLARSETAEAEPRLLSTVEHTGVVDC